MVVLMATRTARADDVQTAWSCSKASDDKTCSFDITIRGEITAATLAGVRTALTDREAMMAREGGEGAWVDLEADRK